MELIPLDPSHIPAAAELCRRVFSRPPWNENLPLPGPLIRYWENLMAINAFWGCALVEDGALIGLWAGLLKPCLEGTEFFLDLFCLDPDHQGRGLGSDLLASAAQALREEGVCRILLTTPADLPAQAFYQKNGFGSREDLRVMLLPL